MKKWTALLLAGLLGLGLTGCGTPLPPEKAADGQDWSTDWVTVGEIIGVDTPDGMDHRENNDALASNGMYYATWSIGEGTPYTNEDGDDAVLYDAQVYLLAGGYPSGGDAENTLAQWRNMAALQYSVDGTAAQTHNGQDFTVITYTFGSEGAPYARGASAFGVYRNFAISVELACRQGFDGDALQLLGTFLDRCHYAMP